MTTETIEQNHAVTDDDVIGMIKAEMENEEIPRIVKEWAEKNAGKPIASNRIPAGFRLRRQYGMTHMDTESYGREYSNKGGFSFLLAYSETGATVPKYTNGGEEHNRENPRGLRELNSCYYIGLETRNAQRRKILDDPKAVAELRGRINIARNAVMNYRQAKEELLALLEYGKPGCAVSTQVERMAGLIEEKK